MRDRPLYTVAVRLDRLVYALFSRHADRPRHERDRERYRGAALAIDFETYLARVYGGSWLVGVGVGIGLLAVGLVFLPGIPAAFEQFVTAVIPGEDHPVPVSSTALFVAGVGIVGTAAKRLTIAVGVGYLRWRANARRAAIERTLPGAVRYLRLLAAGSGDKAAMLEQVAERSAYGETARSFERVLETAALAGSLDTGLRSVARRTP